MSEMSNKVYIGVDPGTDGAMATIANGHLAVIPYDLDRYVKAVRFYRSGEINVFAFVEHVHAMPMNGCKGNFVLGERLGEIEAMFRVLGVPFELVLPQRWKKEFGCTADKQTSIRAARNIFPTFSFRRTEKCTKDHDGMCEAALIAEWGRRHLNG